MLRFMNAILYIRTEIFRVKQSAFAEIAQVGQATVSRWENGIGSPSLEEMARIRTEALSRKLEWDDRWFFAVPQGAAA
jgi:transcriptional regulator with XRE-family HTH domain